MKKKIGIMQPYLFPYLGYFQLMNAVDEYVIYDDVQYIKNGWINRNNILMTDRRVLFTIRLDSTSSNKLINEINVVDDFQKLLKTIGMAYSKAPYKKPVYELIDKICAYQDKNLSRFIGNSFKEINSYMGVDTKLIYSSKLDKDNNLNGQDKVISICKGLKADMYINAIDGMDLYSKKDFTRQGQELKFLKTQEIKYKQFKETFIPNLSIIDVMMFNSPEDIRKMLKDYELI